MKSGAGDQVRRASNSARYCHARFSELWWNLRAEQSCMIMGIRYRSARSMRQIAVEIGSQFGTFLVDIRRPWPWTQFFILNKAKFIAEYGDPTGAISRVR